MTNLRMNKKNFLKQEQAKDEPDTKVIEKLEKEIKELTGILTKANIDRQTNINNVINMKKTRLKQEEDNKDLGRDENVIAQLTNEINQLTNILYQMYSNGSVGMTKPDGYDEAKKKWEAEEQKKKEAEEEAKAEGEEKKDKDEGSAEEKGEDSAAENVTPDDETKEDTGILEKEEKKDDDKADEVTKEVGNMTLDDKKEDNTTADNDSDKKEDTTADSDKKEGEDIEVKDEKVDKDAEEGETKDEPEEEPKEILPPLFARTDAHTLLDRLNTRRLYQRILNFKRAQRKKIADKTAEMMNKVNKDDDELDPMRGIAHMFTEELAEHDQEAKDKATAARIYRKNMTIQEMADKEWKELLEVGNLKNYGKPIPWDPIPTKDELLLFSPCPRAVGILASYPRSGNSLMRTLYEHTTLRVTGSDMQGGLAKHDLVGEMAVGTNMVQFVKTHFPERQGSPAFRASRVVLLVRNPFDALESFFNLMMTGTHTNSLSDEVREKTKKIFEEYVMKEIRVWKVFHEFWLNQDIPILLIRYEDIVRDPTKVMKRVIQFTLEIKRMDTFFSERIERCCDEQAEIERMGSYKPRSGGIGKSVISGKYSPELLAKLKNDQELKTIMGHLGYKDLFTKPPEEWASMKPLQDHAIEYLPSWHETGNQKVVILNRGNLARTKNEITPWQKVSNIEILCIDDMSRLTYFPLTYMHVLLCFITDQS